MRHALSLLTGIAVALLCVWSLHQASSLSLLALAGCGVGVCLLTRTWAYNLPLLRRASVRLRILWRRHVRSEWPDQVHAGPFLRRQLGRVNLMWVSYAVIAGWTFVEILGGSRFDTAPIERAAAGASSAMDAVAGTSAAIRALSAVGEGAQQREIGAGLSATALPKGADADRLMMKTESRSLVMGAAAPTEPRTGDSGCDTSSMLEALLPDPAVKEF